MPFFRLGQLGDILKDSQTIKAANIIGGLITAKELIIAGGTNGIIRSQDFVSGASGWRLRGDGSFEAQDGIFRGTLNADDINAGSLNVDQITTKSITAGKLTIGSVDNLIQNPGFEDETFSPGVVLDPSTGSWGLFTTPRSGAKSLRYFYGSSMSVDARFSLNGTFDVRAEHPAAAEGDVFYFTAWVKETSPNGTTQAFIRMAFRDEDGAFISSATSAIVDPGSAFVLLEKSGTAPAGTAYVSFEAVVDETSTSTSGAVHFDDFYARRKVGTLIIEDQAVDIERMLNPVFAATVDKGINNVSLTTTLTQHLTTNINLPSWVGVLSVLETVRLEITHSTVTLAILQSRIGGVAGSDSGFTAGHFTNHSTIGTVVGARSVSAPGSTVAVGINARVTSGSNSSNELDIVAIATGVR